MTGNITEAEARERYCPIYSAVHAMMIHRELSVDAFSNLQAHWKCKASKCMFWQWSDASRSNGYCGAVRPAQ